MSEFEGERPLTEIRTGRADYQVYENLMEHLEFENKNDLIAQIREAHVALDLGSGDGHSAVALSKFSPNLEEIVGVDATTDVNREVIGELPFRQERTYLNEFLKGNTTHFDIVLISGVPDHRIRKENYRKLAESVSPEGLVIETGETKLDDTEMGIYFDKAYTPKRKQMIGFKDAVWKKKIEAIESLTK